MNFRLDKFGQLRIQVENDIELNKAEPDTLVLTAELTDELRQLLLEEQYKSILPAKKSLKSFWRR